MGVDIGTIIASPNAESLWRTQCVNWCTETTNPMWFPTPPTKRITTLIRIHPKTDPLLILMEYYHTQQSKLRMYVPKGIICKAVANNTFESTHPVVVDLLKSPQYLTFSCYINFITILLDTYQSINKKEYPLWHIKEFFDQEYHTPHTFLLEAIMDYFDLKNWQFLLENPLYPQESESTHPFLQSISEDSFREKDFEEQSRQVDQLIVDHDDEIAISQTTEPIPNPQYINTVALTHEIQIYHVDHISQLSTITKHNFSQMKTQWYEFCLSVVPIIERVFSMPLIKTLFHQKKTFYSIHKVTNNWLKLNLFSDFTKIQLSAPFLHCIMLDGLFARDFPNFDLQEMKKFYSQYFKNTPHYYPLDPSPQPNVNTTPQSTDLPIIHPYIQQSPVDHDSLMTYVGVQLTKAEMELFGRNQYRHQTPDSLLGRMLTPLHTLTPTQRQRYHRDDHLWRDIKHQINLTNNYRNRLPARSNRFSFVSAAISMNPLFVNVQAHKSLVPLTSSHHSHGEAIFHHSDPTIISNIRLTSGSDSRFGSHSLLQHACASGLNRPRMEALIDLTASNINLVDRSEKWAPIHHVFRWNIPLHDTLTLFFSQLRQYIDLTMIVVNNARQGTSVTQSQWNARKRNASNIGYGRGSVIPSPTPLSDAQLVYQRFYSPPEYNVLEFAMINGQRYDVLKFIFNFTPFFETSTTNATHNLSDSGPYNFGLVNGLNYDCTLTSTNPTMQNINTTLIRPAQTPQQPQYYVSSPHGGISIPYLDENYHDDKIIQYKRIDGSIITNQDGKNRTTCNFNNNPSTNIWSLFRTKSIRPGLGSQNEQNALVVSNDTSTAFEKECALKSILPTTILLNVLEETYFPSASGIQWEISPPWLENQETRANQRWIKYDNFHAVEFICDWVCDELLKEHSLDLEMIFSVFYKVDGMGNNNQDTTDITDGASKQKLKQVAFPTVITPDVFFNELDPIFQTRTRTPRWYTP